MERDGMKIRRAKWASELLGMGGGRRGLAAMAGRRFAELLQPAAVGIIKKKQKTKNKDMNSASPVMDKYLVLTMFLLVLAHHVITLFVLAAPDRRRRQVQTHSNPVPSGPPIYPDRVAARLVLCCCLVGIGSAVVPVCCSSSSTSPRRDLPSRRPESVVLELCLSDNCKF